MGCLTPSPSFLTKKACAANCAGFFLSEAGVGFEPTNDGFANRCLRPLGYPAKVGREVFYTLRLQKSSEIC